MSCDSNKTVASGEWQVASGKLPIDGGRLAVGFSLLEMLVAMAVTMVFMGAVATTFIQISKGHGYAEARMEAMRNGRSALTMMCEEIKVTDIKQMNDIYGFLGTDQSLNVGDGIDNDADGAVDEEVVNGVPDTPTPNPPVEDKHAMLGTHSERPLWLSQPDLGDTQVDVDARFGRDQLTISITPKIPTAMMTEKRITYVVTQFEGQDNVLVRQLEVFFIGQPNPFVNISPLAFNVAGLDLLYWDSNGAAADHTWLTTWDSATPDLNLTLPAAVYIRLTMIADTRPASALAPGEPMEVIPLETIVNIETVIGNAQFERPSL